MTTQREIHILFIEDDPRAVVIVNNELRKGGLSVRWKRTETQEAFLNELQNDPPDLILSDYGLPSIDGFTALRLAREKCPRVPFVFVTDALGEQTTFEALHKGAASCVSRNDLSVLVPVVRQALGEADAPRRNQSSTTNGVVQNDSGKSGNCAQNSPDTTPEGEAEVAPRQNESLRSTIVETALDAIVSIDHAGLVQEWNPAAQRIFGYSCGEALGRPMDELIVSPALRQIYQDGLTYYLMTGAGSLLGRPVELRLRRADGAEFEAEMAITRVATEEPPRCTALIRDITARKRTEKLLWEVNSQLERRALERCAELEAARDELEAFSHSVAHDLQTPLRRVLAYTEMLQHEADPQLSQECKGHLDNLATAARQLGHVFNALQAFSRVGRTEIREQRVNLRALVEDARASLRHESLGRTVLWQINELPEVDGDHLLLGQVIFHLLANALKFTRPREETKIEIGTLDGRHETVLFMRDNGVGFDMKYADSLFGVFQRLHPAGEFEGVGIGLATVRRIVWRHGGRVWADGAVDGGATFYIAFPRLARPKRPEPKAGTAQMTAGS